MKDNKIVDDYMFEIEDDYLNLKRNKLLITSISFTSESGQMSVAFCNTEDLPSNTKRT